PTPKQAPAETKGIVTDTSSVTPLSGVTKQMKASSTGTTTEELGRINLSVPEASGSIVTYSGYDKKKITITDNADLTIALTPVNIGLEQVVVVGYGTQKEVNLTGAVAQINADVLGDRPLTNLGQGLQGIVANLNINPGSGALGRGVSFNIRGNTSINGGSPLVLIDGVQM